MSKPGNPLENVAPVTPEPFSVYIENFDNDTDPRKVALGPGVYLDSTGQSITFNAAKKAERAIVENPAYDKNYVIGDGMNDAPFISAVHDFTFGVASQTPPRDCIMSIQTVSGTYALQFAAKWLVDTMGPETTIYVSDPTWSYH
jgi:aspartate/tyrosine/aromatic aminotransferase